MTKTAEYNLTRLELSKEFAKAMLGNPGSHLKFREVAEAALLVTDDLMRRLGMEGPGEEK